MLPLLLELGSTFGLGIVLASRRSAIAMPDRGTASTAGEIPSDDSEARSMIEGRQQREGAPDRFLVSELRQHRRKSVPASELYEKYAAWCTKLELISLGVDAFASRMKDAVAARQLRWGRIDGAPHLLGVTWHAGAET